MGLDAALAKMGCVHGDEVRILGYAFDYEGDKHDDAIYDDDEERE